MVQNILATDNWGAELTARPDDPAIIGSATYDDGTVAVYFTHPDGRRETYYLPKDGAGFSVFDFAEDVVLLPLAVEEPIINCWGEGIFPVY